MVPPLQMSLPVAYVGPETLAPLIAIGLVVIIAVAIVMLVRRRRIERERDSRQNEAG